MAVQRRQGGFSLLGLVFVLAVLAGAGALGARVLPSFLEYRSVLKAVDHAATAASPQEVRSLFDRLAQVENITAVTGRDLDVQRQDGRHVASFAYEKEFHLAGPAWLTLKYAGSSGR